MNCKYCGAYLTDDAKFCAACGRAQEIQPMPVAEPIVEAPVVAPVEAPVVAPVEVPVEAPVVAPVDSFASAEVNVPAEPVAQEAPTAAEGFTAPDFNAPTPKKKKKGGKAIVISLVALIAAAAVFLVYWYWGWIQFKWCDWFGEPQELRDKVVTQQTEKIAEAMSAKYGKAIKNAKSIVSDGQYATTTIELEVSDEVSELLGMAMMGEADDLIEALDGTYVTVSGGQTDNVIQMGIQAGIGGDEVLNMGAVVDMVEEELYVAFPSLTEYHLDLSEVLSETIAEAEAIGLTSDLAMAEELLDALPSEEVINRLANKYVGLILAELDDVSKDKTKLTVGDISEKYTVLETSISKQDIANAIEAAVAEAKDDSDIEDILVTFGDTIGDLSGDPSITGRALYEAFVMMAEDFDMGEYDSDEWMVFTQYLNGAYNIAGYSLEVEGEEVLHCLTATKGKNFAFEMEVMGEEFITGEGTIKKGIVNGTFEVTMDDVSLEITVSNFDKKAFEKGNLNGSFEISLSDEMLDDLLDAADLPSSYGSIASLFNPGIRFDISSTDTEQSLKISVTNDGDVLVGVKMTTTIEDKDVSIPDPNLTTDDVEEWVSTFDLSALYEVLEGLGLPDYVLDGLDQL